VLGVGWSFTASFAEILSDKKPRDIQRSRTRTLFDTGGPT
jgi:hypothetical protein